MDSSSWTTACGYITFNFKLLFLFNILHFRCFLAYENDTWHYSKAHFEKSLIPNSSKLLCKVLLLIMKYYIIKFSCNAVQHNQQATASNYSFLHNIGIFRHFKISLKSPHKCKDEVTNEKWYSWLNILYWC